MALAISASGVILVVLAVASLGDAMTDPVAATCSPLCEDFRDVSNQCAVQRGCYDYVNEDDKFTDCLEPCWDLSAPCAVLCANNFDSNFDVCEEKCKDSPNYDCVHECFDEEFLEQKKSLTLPSPDVGPYEP